MASTLVRYCKKWSRYGLAISAIALEHTIWFWKKKPSQNELVFIIGAPRTGSTLLYQLITHCFDIGYISNLISKFYRTPYLGAILHKALFSNKTHENFNSEYGNTQVGGLISPSECGEFWYQFLPRDHHFIEFNEIQEDKQRYAKEALEKLKIGWKKTIIFKNLNAGQRLRFIKELDLKCKFIWVRRNPLETVHSILNARKALGTPPHQMWSIKPKNFKILEKLEEIEMVIEQIFYLEKQIHDDLKEHYQDQYIMINYNDLCKDPKPFIKRVSSFINQPILREINTGVIKQDQEVLSNSEEIQEKIKKLDWVSFIANRKSMLK